jgi:hypothetical protein
MRSKRSRGKTVPQRLSLLGNIHKDRGKVYKKDYHHLGESLKAMFPDGLTLTTTEEFNRFALFVHLHGKVMRYAQSMLTGGHADSLDDLAVYSMMAQECDQELFKNVRETGVVSHRRGQKKIKKLDKDAVAEIGGVKIAQNAQLHQDRRQQQAFKAMQPTRPVGPL